MLKKHNTSLKWTLLFLRKKNVIYVISLDKFIFQKFTSNPKMFVLTKHLLGNVTIQNKNGLQISFHADFKDARMINEKQAIIISSFENKQDNKFAVRFKGHKREQITLTAIQKTGEFTCR